MPGNGLAADGGIGGYDTVQPRLFQGVGYKAHSVVVHIRGDLHRQWHILPMLLLATRLLILDEATSALDSEVEAAIQDNLYRLMEGKTVIAIAHRLSTIAAMDRLVVLEQGRIAEIGTHDELLRRGGIYAQLWDRQSGGFLDQQLMQAVDA